MRGKSTKTTSFSVASKWNQRVSHPHSTCAVRPTSLLTSEQMFLGQALNEVFFITLEI